MNLCAGDQRDMLADIIYIHVLWFNLDDVLSFDAMHFLICWILKSKLKTGVILPSFFIGRILLHIASIQNSAKNAKRNTPKQNITIIVPLI